MPRLAEIGGWAVVTGASEGIGRAFAVELARRGIRLVLVARREALLEALALELTRAHGVECRALALDLADPAQVQTLVEATAGVDVGLLVAAAGFGTSGPLIESPPAAEQEMLTVNCAAVLALTCAYGRRLAERGCGGIVLMSSLLAFQGVPRSANYAATKAYVQTLAEGLRVELAPHGVAVLACAPGPIASGFARRAEMRMSISQTPDAVARASLKALGRSATVRPGWLSKVLGWSLATLPRWAMVMVMGRIMGSMTSHRPLPARLAATPRKVP